MAYCTWAESRRWDFIANKASELGSCYCSAGSACSTSCWHVCKASEMIARSSAGDNTWANMGVTSTPEAYIWGISANSCNSGCMSNMIVHNDVTYKAYDVSSYSCQDNRGTPHGDERVQGRTAVNSDGSVYFQHTGVSAGNNQWNYPTGHYPNGGSVLDGCTDDRFCCSNKLATFHVAFYCKTD